MLRLEDIKKGAAVAGIDPTAPVRIVATELVGQNALTVIYKTASGAILERMLFRGDEASLSVAVSARPWAFDASAEGFKLATEALRSRADRAGTGGGVGHPRTVGAAGAAAPQFEPGPQMG